MGIMLDVNFHFKTEGFLRIADAVAPYRLNWLEIDSFDPAALATIRSRASCSIASCETLCGRRDFKPYFEGYAVDVAIVDIPWNGLAEGVKIANMADTYEINVAPHNFYGHLCSMHSAHFCAAVPNFRIMEIDIDSVAWRDEFVTAVPVIENGELVLPTAPGWGIDIDETAVRKRPPKA
jgi:L-alanine-DL-glutamate epimerase-like enolase superfamily enzyme